ncbi:MULTISPECIES: hypothetical protein [Lyngbya]|jgi:hypothetical protein|uniref:Putative glutamine synthetase inactivating factor IF7 n=1 Tax=Lyngbya aestuarii BL J TaxID=1348334 RepID=U7QRI0_9CYAN|nr:MULTISPECIES: hypothetical protein [Lyngbya]EAW34940.1 hypothetical protein L8106_21559 [Lyngbya sp. PCC 8106]ERT09735.1 putative glutamine synthetase inactivating factor IF7 [Lyngbya aestuarii BL J]
MGTQDQARSLMMRHHMMVKNRQQAMLNRVADEVGIEVGDYHSTIQGKPTESFRSSYDRSHASMS